MDKLKNIDKKSAIIVTLVVILAGVLGFYGGRYYEQKLQRDRFTQRMNTFQQNGGQRPSGGFGTGMGGDRQFRQFAR